MEDYISMVNRGYLTLFVAAILAFVVAVCIIFLRKGWQESLRLGITNAELEKIVMNSIGISLVPSIPIVLSVLVMVPVLGVALPWLRTSVIGSASNELLSATMAADATGVEFTATGMNIQAYINAAWSMTLGCSIALPIILIVLKPICKTYDTFKKKDIRWTNIFSLCALITVIAAFCVSNGRRGALPTTVIVSCFLFSYCTTLLGKLEKLKWIKDFSFPLTILVGLVISVITASLF